VCSDFEETVADARRGDLVYLDPPYITTHLENGFIKYNARLFTPADEVRLAGTAERLARKGVIVIASNASHPGIRELYDGPFFKYELARMSLIAASAARRQGFKELLISTIPLKGLT
jgi:DNA adenine methylase